MSLKTINKNFEVLKTMLYPSFILLLSSLSHGEIREQEPKLNDEQLFQTCLDNIRKNQDFSKITNTTFDLYRPLQADFTVLDSLNYQPEFNKEPWDYHAALVDPERVSTGII